MMAVAIETGRQLTVGKPKLLFEKDYEIAGYDVAPDGERFLMVRGGWGSTGQTYLVVNWFEELRQRMGN